ncbi:hypothetical protein F4823DRAFT_571751 [Ustulina deusta]|nr:hypothetical protein F4823DRAFT_571751 [Ustulina deusta]
MPRKYFEPTRAVREQNGCGQAQQNHTTEDHSNGILGQLVWAKTPMPPQSLDGITAEGKEMTKEDPLLRKGMCSSPNYRGDPTVLSNQSANIPHSKNTSLWITRLPHKSTYSDLMETLRGRGKILATSITNNSEFKTAAATITFFRHGDAYNVMRDMNNGNLRLQVYRAANGDGAQQPVSSAAAPGDGQGDLSASDSESVKTTGTGMSKQDEQSSGIKLRARWNRVRVAETKLKNNKWGRYPGGRLLPSRVLLIRGPKDIVAPTPLQAFFNRLFRYDLDRIIPLGTDKDGKAEYEYRFGSWKNQVSSLLATPFFFLLLKHTDASTHAHMNVERPVFGHPIISPR